MPPSVASIGHQATTLLWAILGPNQAAGPDRKDSNASAVAPGSGTSTRSRLITGFVFLSSKLVVLASGTIPDGVKP